MVYSDTESVINIIEIPWEIWFITWEFAFMYVGQRHLNVRIKNKFYKSDFIYAESTLNPSKVSAFKVSDRVCENKMSKCGWNNVQLSFSVTLIFM